MLQIAQLKRRIQAETDRIKRGAILVGYLTERLKEDGVLPVLVGGAAVYVYTHGSSVTFDIDVVSTRRELVGILLDELGFAKQLGSRLWRSDELDISLEIPDDRLAGEITRLVEVELEEFGFSVYLIGYEDLIIDRLNAAEHWHSVRDYEQALLVYSLYQGQIDHEYLTFRAKTDRVDKALVNLFNDAAKVSDSSKG